MSTPGGMLTAAPPARTDWLRRVAPPLVLLAVYFSIALLSGTEVFPFDDVAAKAATIRLMDENDTWVPDIGYWAAEDDPDGALHSFVLVTRTDDNWYGVTTLPMLMVARPLYALGGYYLALLPAMLGGIGCAYAARALARKLGASAPDIAFWAVGLASPIVLYSATFWEHSIGLAFMLLGVLKLFDAAESRARTADAFAAGAAFGVASTMRTEAFVYAAAAALVIGVWKWRELRTRTRIRIQQVVAFGVAMLVIFVFNAGLERLVLGESLRGGRTSDVAGSIATDVSQRVENTWMMTFDSGFDRGWTYRALGIMVALGLAVAAYGVWRAWPRRRVTMALAIAIGGSLVIAVDPVAIGGMFVAFPLAAAGIGVLGATTQTRVAAAIALVGLVGVALTSYEQFDPLWGGRYSLPTPMLFGVIAIAVLDARDRRFVAIVFGVGVLMTGSSLLAHFDRQSSREAAYAHVTDLPDEVLIARNEALLRHASGYYEKDSRWLGTASRAEIEEGARIAARAGSDDFYLLGVGTWPPPEVEGWTAGAVDRWTGGEDGYFIQVVRYRRTS